MSQPDDALDRAFTRLCLAVIKSAVRDAQSNRAAPCARRRAREFFQGDAGHSHYWLYRDWLAVSYPGARLRIEDEVL